MTWEQVITLLAVVGSALTVYFNLKKFGDNIRTETEWRAKINSDLSNLIEKVTTLLDENRELSVLIKELLEFKIKQNSINDNTEKEIKALWKRVDENRHEITKLLQKTA